MDFSSPATIKELLANHGASPSKRLGQNFLIDKNALTKVIESADLQASDTVVEIGPGIGTLTQALAKRAGKVIAIEKDRAMVDILGKTLTGCPNLEIIQGDILKLDPSPYTLAPYKLIANIPYYITSPIIRLFLEAKNPPTHMVLMVQKEVAQRIVARPPNMSILAVSVQFYAKPEIISYVKKGCFWPMPNVDSAIIKITPYASGPTSTDFRDQFFKVVKAGFLHPRKKLINNLSEGLIMDKEKVTSWLFDNHIDPARRAETLTIQEWQALTEDLTRGLDTRP